MTRSSQSGYTAIASVLVIAAVMFVISSSVSLLSIDELQSSLSLTQSEVALNSVEGCIESILLELSNSDSIPVAVTHPDVTCSVSSISQNGGEWSLDVTGTVGEYSKTLRVVAQRNGAVEVLSWQEI